MEPVSDAELEKWKRQAEMRQATRGHFVDAATVCILRLIADREMVETFFKMILRGEVAHGSLAATRPVGKHRERVHAPFPWAEGHEPNLAEAIHAIEQGKSEEAADE